MNTAYIRFCVSLLAVVCMAMLAGGAAGNTQRASWIWPAAIFAALSATAGTLYLNEKYRSAMLATEKAHAQIERLERAALKRDKWIDDQDEIIENLGGHDEVVKYRRRSAEEWPSEIEG